jgi:hypothetical protein
MKTIRESMSELIGVLWWDLLITDPSHAEQLAVMMI